MRFVLLRLIYICINAIFALYAFSTGLDDFILEEVTKTLPAAHFRVYDAPNAYVTFIDLPNPLYERLQAITGNYNCGLAMSVTSATLGAIVAINMDKSRKISGIK